MKLDELKIATTYIAVPLEIRITSVDPDDAGRVVFKWKMADATRPETFEEPTAAGEPKPYLIGDLRLSRDVLDIASPAEVRGVIAEAIARDVLHLALQGAREQASE